MTRMNPRRPGEASFTKELGHFIGTEARVPLTRAEGPAVNRVRPSEGVKKLGLWRGSSDPRVEDNRKFVRVLTISLTRS